MIITHKLKNEISRNVSAANRPTIFLVDRRGSFLALPADHKNNITNFNGWFNFIEPYSMYKSIDNLYIDSEVAEVSNEFCDVKRVYRHGVKDIFTILESGLIYELQGYSGYIHIDLDFRRIFDNSDKGRIYKITKKNEELLIIEYKKYSDDNLSELVDTYYLAISGFENFEKVDTWSKKKYSYDEQRSAASEFYIYNAFKIKSSGYSKLLFTFGSTESSVVEKMISLAENLDLVEKFKNNYTKKLEKDIQHISDKEIALAYANSVQKINDLLMTLKDNNNKFVGLIAGLPWFYHMWSRDELISSSALISLDKHDVAKDIMMRHLHSIQMNGRIPSIYPATTLGSADAVGWLFKRISEVVEKLQESMDLSTYFSLYDLKYIKDRLEYSIRQTQKYYFSEGLLLNRQLETWMDTSYKMDNYETDFREGARIEIQALFLSMLKLAAKLEDMLSNKLIKKQDNLVNAEENDYTTMEKEMKSKVLYHFLKINDDGKITLNDGYIGGYTDVARPNVFLAHYAYSELLSQKEWIAVFDNCIDKLWCEWKLEDGKIGGGFSTIEKTSPLYHGFYTGQNNKSYHRGDVWFYLNNIAAMCMLKLDKKKYSKYIEKIINSSTDDILYYGFIGAASELSSSAIFNPSGCMCQSWSIATYIELVDKIFKK